MTRGGTAYDGSLEISNNLGFFCWWERSFLWRPA